MLVAIESPISAVASRVASTNSASPAPTGVADLLLHRAGREGQVGILHEIAAA